MPGLWKRRLRDHGGSSSGVNEEALASLGIDLETVNRVAAQALGEDALLSGFKSTLPAAFRGRVVADNLGVMSAPRHHERASRPLTTGSLSDRRT